MKFSGIDVLKIKNNELYKSIESVIKSNKFPCLFAINSFHKKQMYVYDASNESPDTYIQSIYKQLNIFHRLFCEENSVKNFYTILVVVPTLKKTDSNTIQNFLFNLLINLKNQDQQKNSLTFNEILRDDFEFSLNGNIWFPVLLCNNHISLIRQTKDITLIAFQPKKTFEDLKKCPNNFYEKTRIATHKKIDVIYSFKRPFFLSEKSSGVNSIQYLGFDPKNPNE